MITAVASKTTIGPSWPRSPSSGTVMTSGARYHEYAARRSAQAMNPKARKHVFAAA